MEVCELYELIRRRSRPVAVSEKTQTLNNTAKPKFNACFKLYAALLVQCYVTQWSLIWSIHAVIPDEMGQSINVFTHFFHRFICQFIHRVSFSLTVTGFNKLELSWVESINQSVCRARMLMYSGSHELWISSMFQSTGIWNGWIPVALSNPPSNVSRGTTQHIYGMTQLSKRNFVDMKLRTTLRLWGRNRGTIVDLNFYKPPTSGAEFGREGGQNVSGACRTGRRACTDAAVRLMLFRLRRVIVFVSSAGTRPAATATLAT